MEIKGKSHSRSILPEFPSLSKGAYILHSAKTLDRSKGGQPFPLRDISDGGSGCAADALSGNT